MKKLFGLDKKKPYKTVESKEQNNQAQNGKGNSTKKPTLIYIPPIIIDDVTFSTADVKSQKEIPKIEKKLLQIYDKDYLKKYGYERLCVQIVKQKDFRKILRTTQKNLIYHNINEDQDNVKTRNGLKKILLNDTFLKHFWSIDFCKLRVMNLSGHNLRSVEGLTFMQLPQLACLELHTNEIMNIDCLSKMSLPKLRILTLYNNKISSANQLCRSKFPQLSHMEFDYQDQNYDPKVQNIFFIFKMQQRNLEKLYLHDDDRIMNKKIYKKLDQFFMRGQYLKTNANRFMWKRRNNRYENDWGNMIVD